KRSDEPDLVHAGDNETEGQNASGNGRRARWKTPWNVPVLDVVCVRVIFTEKEMFYEDDSGKGAGPVANKTQEVGEGSIKARGTYDRERDNAKITKEISGEYVTTKPANDDAKLRTARAVAGSAGGGLDKCLPPMPRATTKDRTTGIQASFSYLMEHECERLVGQGGRSYQLSTL
ncbi:hypothetical protein C0991_010847, partial [Blastosporella zonata]